MLVILLGLAFLPALILAQSQTAPADAATATRRLEIGPITGLTTAWHPAPVRAGVPLGATLRLQLRTANGSSVTWSGARVVAEGSGRSTAEVAIDAPGIHTVTASYRDASGQIVAESSLFEAVDTTAHPVRITAARPTVEPVSIDPANVNASTMRYFFQDGSIAALRQLGSDQYVTSANRWLTLEADIEPASLAPLVEWKLDGQVQRFLGSPVLLRMFTAGQHNLSVSPSAAAPQMAIQTYFVRISGPERAEEIPDGAQVTFHARTEPAGFEAEVTWLATTKYGDCSPMMGRGGEFTVRFDRTTGLGGRWLGVRADDAAVGADQKENVPIPDLSPWFNTTMCRFVSANPNMDPQLATALQRYCGTTPPRTRTSLVAQAEVSESGNTLSFTITCTGSDLDGCQLVAAICDLKKGVGHCGIDGICVCVIPDENI